MKIEIGESLMLSYIKHIKGCLFYQTNWKASNNWMVDESIYDKVRYNYNVIIKHPEFSDIFKSELDQLIKQSEIDVLGMDMEGKIYTAEIAFHENGLNYGSKIETKNRIFKKLLRSYLTLLAYFPDKKYELVFASPKVHNATEIIISDYFSVLNNNFSNENVTFKYFSNDVFNKEILIPTIEKTRNYSDSNELFSRSVKLLDIFDIVNNGNNDTHFSVNHDNEYITSGNETTPENSFHVSPQIPDMASYAANITTPRKEFFINGVSQSCDAFEEYLRGRSCKVKVTIIYKNGQQEQKQWNVNSFGRDSNLSGNLHAGFLRGWQRKGITGIKLEI